MYKIIFSRQTRKSLKKIPRRNQERLKQAIEILAANPRRIGVVKLTAFGAADYRFRVGNYRILFDILEEKKLLLISDIKRRTSTTY